MSVCGLRSCKNLVWEPHLSFCCLSARLCCDPELTWKLPFYTRIEFLPFKTLACALADTAFVISTTPQVNSNQWEGLPSQAPGGRVVAAEVPIGLQRQTVAAHATCLLSLLLSQGSQSGPWNFTCPQAWNIAQVELGFMILGDSTNIFRNSAVCVENTFCSISFVVPSFLLSRSIFPRQ